MIFKHNQTKKDAIWIDIIRQSPDAIEIKNPFDLPPMSFWEQVNIHPAILKQGFRGLDCFLKAFFSKTPKIYYVWIFPSAFPDEILPNS